MIRSSISSCRLAARHNRRLQRSIVVSNQHKHHLFSTEAAASSVQISISALDNETFDATTPFFDEVDEIMKRDSPMQYQRFLESKASSESWREMQQRNEQSRRREYSQSSQTNDVSTINKPSPPAFANEEVVAAINPTKEEIPWYKRRSDMSAFASSGTSNTTLPTKYLKYLQTKNPEEEEEPSSSASNIKSGDSISINIDGSSTIKKRGGVFSSISKDANNGDKKTSTSIPLSELFPTLYGNNAQTKESSTLDEKPINNNPAMMYNTDHYEAYEQAMTAVFDDNRTNKFISKFEAKDDKDGGDLHRRIVQSVKDWLLNDHRVVDTDVVKERWGNVEEAWKDGKWMTGLTNGAEDDDGSRVDEMRFRDEMKVQQDFFLSELLGGEEGRNDDSDASESVPDSNDDDNTTSAESENPKDLTLSEVDPVLFFDLTRHIMGTLGRYCARRARSTPMIVTWWKIKESGILLPRDIISTYLYVVSTMGMAGDNSIGTSSGGIGLSSYPSSSNTSKMKDEEDEEARLLIPEEVATYHDLSSKPTESSISLRVKALAQKGETKSAEELLEAFKKSIDSDKSSKELIRLRTYLPILKEYCESGDVSSALSLFKRMQTTNGVILEPENYVLLLATIAENKCFCDDSSPIEGAKDLGYTHSHGPGLFDELTTEMAADALEITSSSARRLYNSLAMGFQQSEKTSDSDTIVSTLKEVHPLMSMPLTRESANANEVVASRVLLDRNAGICPVTKAQQRLIILEENQRAQLHDDLLNLSTEQFAKFAGKKSHDSPNRAREQLQQFSGWLNKREGEPFTAILDGANIGYYMQTFEKGIFNLHQIQFMVDALEEQGENPLVILPNKYGYNEFYSSKREYQRLDQKEIEIMKDLTQKGKLYRVPPRCLDDFYWMLASVSDQTASRKGQDLSVSNNDPSGRFPGTRPMLITNDQMRDHRLELLEPRLFRRWYGCHIVNYNFTAFVMGESVAGNEVGFSPADLFSREIQGNECPANPGEGGEDDAKWGGQAWHFPVNDWDLDERFVIRIPTKK